MARAAASTSPLRANPGEFTLGATLRDPSINGPRSVAAADLDGDGDLDLVSANEEGNNLTIFLQTQSRLPPLRSAPGREEASPTRLRTTFTLDDTLSITGPVAVAAADLDGDGDLDLVSANQDSDNLTIFFQDASGQFRLAAPLSGSIRGPLSVAAADLDGDGDLDLVSANLGSENLTIFFQTAPGQFTQDLEPLSDPSLNIPTSVAAADLDGDGELDLVSSSEGGDALIIFSGGH